MCLFNVFTRFILQKLPVFQFEMLEVKSLNSLGCMSHSAPNGVVCGGIRIRHLR